MPDTSSSSSASSSASDEESVRQSVQESEQAPPGTPPQETKGKGKGKAYEYSAGQIPVPASAAPDAFRKHCRRGLYQITKGKEVDQTWPANSKKCGYCISQNGDCNWVPLCCEAEYAHFAQADEVWKRSRGTEAEAAALEVRRVAAIVLVETIKVSNAQLSQEGPHEVLSAIASHTQATFSVIKDMHEKQVQRDGNQLVMHNQMIAALSKVAVACGRSPIKGLKRKAVDLDELAAVGGSAMALDELTEDDGEGEMEAETPTRPGKGQSQQPGSGKGKKKNKSKNKNKKAKTANLFGGVMGGASGGFQ